jgi:phosphoribosyl-AMP cyclohydrolase
VLMVAYMNAESLERTLEEGRTVFWSRSRHELWRKGETSGDVQHVESVRVDCDADTLLVRVHQTGAACHTGNRTCFYREIGAS